MKGMQMKYWTICNVFVENVREGEVRRGDAAESRSITDDCVDRVFNARSTHSSYKVCIIMPYGTILV